MHVCLGVCMCQLHCLYLITKCTHKVQTHVLVDIFDTVKSCFCIVYFVLLNCFQCMCVCVCVYLTPDCLDVSGCLSVNKSALCICNSLY